MLTLATMPGDSPPPPAPSEAPAWEADLTRPETQTWLTWPEWFLVDSPTDYAAHLAAGGSPAQFPWMGHLVEFWGGYRAIRRETRALPPNPSYHAMIWTIGLSTTAEYLVKGAWEVVVGRVTEWLRGPTPTPEDHFNTRYAEDYCQFLLEEPWFHFDYLGRLRSLWTDLPWWGPAPLRKWERRYLLTTELLFKAGYGWVLAQASAGTFGAVAPWTPAHVDRLPAGLDLPRMELKAQDGAGAEVWIPRYRPFTEHAVALARAGVEFQSIAGNDATTRMLLSAQIEASASQAGLPDSALLLRSAPVVGTQRVRWTLVTPIGQLSQLIRALEDSGARIEHVYDF